MQYITTFQGDIISIFFLSCPAVSNCVSNEVSNFIFYGIFKFIYPTLFVFSLLKFTVYRTFDAKGPLSGKTGT